MDSGINACEGCYAHRRQNQPSARSRIFCGLARPDHEPTDPLRLPRGSRAFRSLRPAGGTGLWDSQDGFFYDQIDYGTHSDPLRIRSLVGLLPMIAVELLDTEQIDRLPRFKKRFQWFLKHRPELARNIRSASADPTRGHGKTILAIPSRTQLTRIMEVLMDESEFLSGYGIRGVSKFHEAHPFVFNAEGTELRLDYTPAEGNSYLFGGNSNWRGPIWFPDNYLIVEALERYH